MEVIFSMFVAEKRKKILQCKRISSQEKYVAKGAMNVVMVQKQK